MSFLRRWVPSGDHGCNESCFGGTWSKICRRFDGPKTWQNRHRWDIDGRLMIDDINWLHLEKVENATPMYYHLVLLSSTLSTLRDALIQTSGFGMVVVPKMILPARWRKWIELKILPKIRNTVNERTLSGIFFHQWNPQKLNIPSRGSDLFVRTKYGIDICFWQTCAE